MSNPLNRSSRSCFYLVGFLLSKSLGLSIGTIHLRRTTIAVGEGTDASGNPARVVGSSERKLRAVQRAMLQPGEVKAKGPGHAEVTVLNYDQSNGVTIQSVGAGRPICASCELVSEHRCNTSKSPGIQKRTNFKE